MAEQPRNRLLPAVGLGLAALLLGFCGGWVGSAINQPESTQGVAGQPGGTGETGQPGADGSDGRDGSDGADGSAGARGTQGLPGAPGAKGDQGVPGAVGPSGPPGPSGAPGVPGEPGEQGEQGEQGADATSLISWGTSFISGLSMTPPGSAVTVTFATTSGSMFGPSSATIETPGTYRVGFTISGVVLSPTTNTVVSGIVLLNGVSFAVGQSSVSDVGFVDVSAWQLGVFAPGDQLHLQVHASEEINLLGVKVAMTLERIG